MSIFSSIGTALPFLLQSVPAVKTGLKGQDLRGQQQALSAMQPLAAQQTQLAKAQYDPNSPLFQGIYNQEKEMGGANLADTIAEISRQNRKLQTLGRAPLLDQERGGENVFRNLVKGQQDVGERARLNTISRLSGAQTSVGRAQDAYRNIYGAQSDLSKTGYENDVRKALGYYSMGDVLQGLFGLNQNQNNYGQDIIQNRDGSYDSIKWNGPRIGAG